MSCLPFHARRLIAIRLGASWAVDLKHDALVGQRGVVGFIQVAASDASVSFIKAPAWWLLFGTPALRYALFIATSECSRLVYRQLIFLSGHSFGKLGTYARASLLPTAVAQQCAQERRARKNARAS